MQIVTVAPIVRGVLKERLSYFSKEPLEVGMIIVVPVRTREIPAIVLEARMVSDEKSTIKSSEYAIRKITRAHPRRIWTRSFLLAAQKTADFCAQKFGETLLSLTPKAILDAHLEGDLRDLKTDEREREGTHTRLFAIQGDTKTRLEHWERLVRESFARNESIFICLPTEDDVTRIAQKLERGISDYTYALHSGLTKKKLIERWNKILKEQHPILVIGTAQYVSVPRYFKTIVLDEEHIPTWKTMTRPLIDQRIFVEEYARACMSNLIFGAPLLRAETHARLREGQIEEFGRVALRAYTDIQSDVVDPRAEEKSIYDETGKHKFVVLSTPLREVISNATSNNKSVLLVVARKGLSPITSCGDCGALVRCPECDTPLVIHKSKVNSDSHVFVCHSCGFMRKPEDNVHETCPQCGGWKLEGVGVGVDRVEDEIRKSFPSVHIFIIDGDRARTRAQAKKIVAQFEKTPGSVLVATPMAIPLLNTVSHTAIVSIDSLFAIPDIRMPERIFGLVLALREKTTEQLLIQTRADDTTLFTQALTGDLAQFMENELYLRKSFSYPPFGTIIKITLRGKRDEVAGDIERLRNFLNVYDPIISGAMAKEPKNMFRMHVLLKLAEHAWPSTELLNKLRALPPQMVIEVNPNSLL